MRKISVGNLHSILNKKANERLLESYNSERRGATLDVFANATKSTRFMTPPTYGWLTMRDAALSLALRHKFAGVLANPRQMEPYSYAKSSITMPDDENFLTGPKPGTVMENFSFNDKFLSDMLDKGFNILWFGEKLKKYNRKDYPNLICLDPQSKIGELYGASNRFFLSDKTGYAHSWALVQNQFNHSSFNL